MTAGPLPTTATAAFRRMASSFPEAYRLGQLELALRQDDPVALQSAYDDWLASTGLNVWDLDILRRYGPPSAIEIDPYTQLPVAGWSEIPEEVAMEPLPADSPIKHFLNKPAPVFVVRPIDQYPTGSVAVPIADPGHVAVLNVVDVLRAQIADVQWLRGELSPTDTYAALQELCSLYDAIADVAVKSLTVDQYVHWDAKPPGYTPYPSIPSTIERHAATMVCHRALALYLCAKAFVREVTASERLASVERRELVDILFDRLSTFRAHLMEVAEALTRSLARQSSNDLSRFALHVPLRTSKSRDTGPTLVLVPNDASATVVDFKS